MRAYGKQSVWGTADLEERDIWGREYWNEGSLVFEQGICCYSTEVSRFFPLIFCVCFEVRRVTVKEEWIGGNFAPLNCRKFIYMSWLGLVVILSTGICINILSRFEAISSGLFRFDRRVDLIVIVILLGISIIFEIVWSITTYYRFDLKLYVYSFERSLRFSDRVMHMWLLFLVMNFGGISCPVWFYPQAGLPLLEIDLALIHATKLWMQMLIRKLPIIDWLSLSFWSELNYILFLFLQIARVLSLHVYIVSGLLQFWTAVIYITESYTKRWTMYSYVFFLMYLTINRNVLSRYETICTLPFMIICKGQSYTYCYLICVWNRL